jgi:hypothetical protein
LWGNLLGGGKEGGREGGRDGERPRGGGEQIPVL